MRGKLEVALAGLTGAGKYDSPANVTAELLLPGATATNSETWTANAESHDIRVDDPGAIVNGSLVNVVISGIWLEDTFLQCTLDPYVSGSEWYVRLQSLTGAPFTLVAGDEIVMADATAANRIPTYTYRKTGSAGFNAHGAGSDGLIETYTRAKRFDLLVADATVGTKIVRDIDFPTTNFVTPEAFGGIGDSSTNDTKAVNKAILHAGLLGGATVLLSAIYLVDADEITIGTANTEIIGQGFNTGFRTRPTAGTTITVTADDVRLANFKMLGQTTTSTGTAAIAIEVASGASRFIADNLKITGLTGFASYNVGIKLSDSDFEINRCKIDNLLGTAAGFGIGIWCVLVTDSKITSNRIAFDSGGRHGILLDAGCQFNDVSLNTIEGGTAQQIYVTSTQAQPPTIGNNVLGNRCRQMQGSGTMGAIHLYDNCTLNKVDKNVVYGANPIGIHFEANSAVAGSCAGNTLGDNLVILAEEDGIIINGADKTKMFGGLVSDSGQSAANTFANVVLKSNTSALGTDIMLFGVTGLGATSPKYGLEIDGTTTASIIGCGFNEGATSGYTDGGTGTIIDGGDMGSTQAFMKPGLGTLGGGLGILGGMIDMNANDIDLDQGAIRQMRVYPRASSVASAGTISLATNDGLVEITGTTDISIIGTPITIGRVIKLWFTNALPPDLVTGGAANGEILVAVTEITQNQIVTLTSVHTGAHHAWAPETI